MHSETRLFVICSTSMESKGQSHAAHIVTDTALLGQLWPGTRDMCFMALQLRMAQNDARFCTRGRLHQVIYFLYPGVQPTISDYSNITPLPCQLLIVQIWKQYFAEGRCILRRVKRKNCSTPTSSWEPLFPGCKVVKILEIPASAFSYLPLWDLNH